MQQNRPKIFNIGLSRTGTTLLHSVFAGSGLRSEHFLGLDRDRAWAKIDRADCVGDTPVPELFRECDRRYPGSRFILTTRDKEQWLASMRWMLTKGRVVFNYGERMDAYHKKFYGTATYDRVVLAKFWDDYHAGVHTYFSGRESDLLVVNIDTINLRSISEFVGVELPTATPAIVNARRDPGRWRTIKYLLNRQLKRIP